MFKRLSKVCSIYLLLPVFLVAGMLGQDALSAEIGPRLHEKLQQHAGQGIKVILSFKGKPDLEAFRANRPDIKRLSRKEKKGMRRELVRQLRRSAETSQVKIRSFLRQQGISRQKPLWHINALAVEVPAEILPVLAAMPEVEKVVYDEVVYRHVSPPVTMSTVSEGNIAMVGAPDLWALGFTGQGVTVAIMDTGVDSQHPELLPRWRGGTNSWFNAVAQAPGCAPQDPQCTCDNNTSEPCDFIDSASVAHGTGVAGILVGGDLSGTAIGVAPGADWIAAKIFDSSEAATFSGIHSAFAWLLDPDNDPDTDDAPDIVNSSWGFSPLAGCVTEFEADIQALKTAGIAVVFSAGNDGPAPATSASPASSPDSFAVGYVGTWSSATEVGAYSSRGPSLCDGTVFPEIMAPGFNLKSTTDSSGGANANAYAYGLSGTSFAAPHVTGVMALLLSAFPDLTVAELENSLVRAATEEGDVGPDNSYGFGLLNGLAAYNDLVSQGVPGFELLFPNGNEVFSKGDAPNIAWTKQPLADSYRLHYFDADGTPHAVANLGNVNTFTWTVPADSRVEPGKRVRVSAFNAGTFLGADYSDGTFAVVSPLLPNGGEVFSKGATYQLRWAAVPGADSYRLHYFDADQTPHLIGVAGAVTSLDWTVPFDVSAEPGKTFRVVAFSAGVAVPGAVQWSDGTFEVVTQLHPDGGEVFAKGETYPLAWAAVPGADGYRLHYFDADGTPHLIQAVGATTGYNWTLPFDVRAEAGKRFRVVAFSGGAALPGAIQWSEGSFTVATQFSPNGGEILTQGMVYPLTWSAVAGADSYRLHYFDADGTAHLIHVVSHETGFSWLVPAGSLPEPDKTFRVAPYGGGVLIPAGVQWSDETFTITPP